MYLKPKLLSLTVHLSRASWQRSGSNCLRGGGMILQRH
jgi:hypothetical protein